jgi:hypothetical protein
MSLYNAIRWRVNKYDVKTPPQPHIVAEGVFLCNLRRSVSLFWLATGFSCRHDLL